MYICFLTIVARFIVRNRLLSSPASSPASLAALAAPAACAPHVGADKYEESRLASTFWSRLLSSPAWEGHL